MLPTVKNLLFILVVLTLTGGAWFKIYELSEQRLQFTDAESFYNLTVASKHDNTCVKAQQDQEPAAGDKLKSLQEQLLIEQQKHHRLAQELEQLKLALDIGASESFSTSYETSETRTLSEKLLLMEQTHERITQYEQVLAVDIEDPGWHKIVTSRLGELLKQLGENESIVTEVDCRKTICRIDLEHQNEMVMEAFSKSIPLLDNNAEIFFDNTAFQDGCVTTVIYLAKQDTKTAEIGS